MCACVEFSLGLFPQFLRSASIGTSVDVKDGRPQITRFWCKQGSNHISNKNIPFFIHSSWSRNQVQTVVVNKAFDTGYCIRWCKGSGGAASVSMERAFAVVVPAIPFICLLVQLILSIWFDISFKHKSATQALETCIPYALGHYLLMNFIKLSIFHSALSSRLCLDQSYPNLS